MFKKIPSIFIYSAFILCQLQGCASIFNNGSQSIIVTSAEDEEKIAVDVKTSSGRYKSKLPTTIVTSPSSFNDTEVTVKEKCYENTTIKAGKSITPSFWANLLQGFAFPIGMAIDFLTGDMWKMDSQILVPLNKISSCKK